MKNKVSNIFLRSGSRLFLLVLFALFGMLVVSISAYAQVTNADQNRALRNLEQTQQKQENLLKSLEGEQEQQVRERKKSQDIAPENIGKEEVKNIDKKNNKEPCFNIKTIDLKGATILKAGDKKRILAKYLSNMAASTSATLKEAGTCMGITKINNLMREITNYYIENGYVTTRVMVPQQDMKPGNLQIIVMEGFVEDIILNDNDWQDRAQVAMAFPFMRGKILNLRNIEQGLDQLNRIASSNATMKLMPGSKTGGTKVIIANKPLKPNRASIGYNNSGQPATGRNKGTLGVERDNLFGVGDEWSFNYNKDTAAHSGMKNSQVYSGNFSLPFGYWTFSQNASHSEYLQTINGSNQSFQASGQTDSSASKLERVIFRNQDSKVSFGTALKFKDIKAFIADVPSTSGTYKLSIWEAGIDYTLRALGTIWSLATGYERGLKQFGAKYDSANTEKTSPHAQFDKYTLSASIYTPFSVGSASLAWRSLISGQYSNETLYSSERISVGDRYTVRGFADNSIQGDSGIYNRNELVYNMPTFTKNKYFNIVSESLQPYVAVDVGTTRASGGKQADGSTGVGYISGWAAGIRSNSELLSVDLSYAEPIKSPVFINSKPEEIYFMVATKVGF